MKKQTKKEIKRINVELSIEEHGKFKLLADKEARSMANWATVLIRRYILEALSKHSEGQLK